MTKRAGKGKLMRHTLKVGGTVFENGARGLCDQSCGIWGALEFCDDADLQAARCTWRDVRIAVGVDEVAFVGHVLDVCL